MFPSCLQKKQSSEKQNLNLKICNGLSITIVTDIRVWTIFEIEEGKTLATISDFLIT